MAEVSESTISDPESHAVTELSDGELVRRVRAGDEDSFAILFERHKRRVAIIASRFFNHREQIEDVVQDAFVKAYLAIESFGGEYERSFPAWLASITTNVAYDKRRPQSELTDEELSRVTASLRDASAAADIERTLITRDLAGKLLARLGAEDRLVLTLLNGEETSVAEVAELTGWSIAKVKVRAHRARGALRRIIGKLL